MTGRLLATTFLALVVGLAGCSSADDQPRPLEATTNGVPDRYKGTASERSKIVRQAAEDRRADLPWISVDELGDRISRGEQVRIVNIKAAIDEPLIEGATVVEGAQLEAWAARAPRTPPIVVYCSCEADGSAVRAALKLRELGFEETRILRGGLTAWQQAGLPVSNVR